MAFVKACRNSGFKGSFQFVPCCTKFSFADSQASRCYERLIIHYPTSPPCRTEVDTLEEGTVPILISLQQMRNLYMFFRHTPDCDYITCAAFGLKDYPIPISTSNHLLLNLADLKTPPERIECQFLSRDIGLIRSAEEVMPSSAMLADSLVHMKNGQGQSDVLASKGPVSFEKDELDCTGEELHPALAGTDEM